MPQHLCVEITGSAFVQDAERALAVLIQLKQLGVTVALEDFGTGYWSLAYLKSFLVDILKVDQSFIGDLTEDASSHAIVLKTIELAQLSDDAVVSKEWRQRSSFARSLTRTGCSLSRLHLPHRGLPLTTPPSPPGILGTRTRAVYQGRRCADAEIRISWCTLG